MPANDAEYMRQALSLARRGCGFTSPNPIVGAVLVKAGRVIGKGWHRGAGLPHAEIEAMNDARSRNEAVRNATLYVTLEPCCTTGRTPPCTDAILDARIRRLVAGAIDPNPAHAGKGFEILRKAGVEVQTGILEKRCTALNPAFNHWIVHKTPLVTVKAAMTLDGKIATREGESKWITGEKARAFAMKLRKESDAIIVGINTVLLDNPALTARGLRVARQPLRVVLDPKARTPLSAALVTDANAARTIVAVSAKAPATRVRNLERCVTVLRTPLLKGLLDLDWLLRWLGQKNILSALVEGGGEANASFLLHGLAHRIAFFYAPKVLGGSKARKAVAGDGASSTGDAPLLQNPRWRRLGQDLLLVAEVQPPKTARRAG